MPLNNETKPGNQQSLARKLALLYASTTFSVLLIASGLLYWTILDHLQKEHQSLLASKITELRHYFKTTSLLDKNLYDLIDAEHHHSGASHSSAIHPGIPHHVFLRIYDEQKNLLIESNITQPIPKGLQYPTAEKQNLSTIAIIKSDTADGQQYLLGSAWAATTHEGEHRQLLIQGLLKLSPDEVLLTDYQRALILVLVFGVLASAFTGFWVTRSGLRPLRQITSTIENINVQQLNARLESEPCPLEIAVLANAFNQMLNRLDQSFVRLSQFSADLAHELRTPVNNLMGASEVALSRERTAEEYQEILASSMEECGRIARMIDELLFLARAEDPKTEINCDFFSVDDEFERIKDFYECLAAEQQVEIICQAQQLILYADPNLFRRVLSNLISNALRYTPEQGKIELKAAIQDNKLVVSVCDNGSGIPENMLEHIFDRFFQADESRHHQKQGSGLGLAIVKSIMELHNGSVSIDSKLDSGSSIKLYFPHFIKKQNN